jgi:acetylornithine deacetylase/succinyl-diaminopimelate desuccinylase-like protein
MHRLVDDALERKRQLLALVADRAELVFHSVSQPQLLTTLEGFPQKAVNFGTDIPYLCTMAPCLLFGPGSVHDAHTELESISLNEVEEAVQYFVRLHNALMQHDI